MGTAEIKTRDQIRAEDKWDLSSLFASEAEWEKALADMNSTIPTLSRFKGTLGQSAEKLAECLKAMTAFQILAEKTGSYAMLQFNTDGSDPQNQKRYGLYISAATNAEAETSYLVPEIQAIDDAKIAQFMQSPLLADYTIYLSKLLRQKPHILSEKEEKLLALHSEADMTAHKAFSALTDVDMEFGTITEGSEEKPLTQSTFTSFLQSKDRTVRQKAYQQFYQGFNKHKNTIAALYAGNVQLDIFTAKARNYGSALEAALSPDNVPISVYNNLIETMHRRFPVLHRYYGLKRQALNLDKLAHYDVYMPFTSAVEVKHTYEEAVDEVIEAVAPLGEEYCSVLKSGLTGGWVDKYENKGKRSGAFSAGCYTGWPYILLNYKEDRLRDLFTLVHEGGHSMHSYYSVKSNPFPNYDYTIFEAETASTFNEQLLARHLMKKYADNPDMLLYLAGKQADDFVATAFRQTMFAEFEKNVHALGESGVPLTLELFRSEYRKLLASYFGPDVDLPEEADLEGLRIPHFYRAFYVYKYATGISAAVALADMVLGGGEAERRRYLDFLCSGGRYYPLDSLKKAGVDMRSPEPVEKAIDYFAGLLDLIENLMKK